MSTLPVIIIGMLVLLTLGLGAGFFSWWLSHRRSQVNRVYRVLPAWLSDLSQGLSTEMIGAFITTFFLVIIVSMVQEYQDVAQRKQQLLLQMGSPDNGVAVEAVRQARVLGWLNEDLLVNANLAGADLSNANLSEVSLASVNLSGAILVGTDFFGADLSGVDFSYANLRNSILVQADMQNAKLYNADLEEAILFGSNLSGTNLISANLENAAFSAAQLIGRNSWLLSQGLLSDMWGNEPPVTEDTDLVAARQFRTLLMYHEQFIDHILDLYGQGRGDEAVTKMDNSTVLPDLETYDPEIGLEQLERFIDRNHSEFWRDFNPLSPAFE